MSQRISSIRHHAACVACRGELIGNIALVAATGWHEWGNEVGWACVPLIVALLVHLLCGAAITEE